MYLAGHSIMITDHGSRALGDNEQSRYDIIVDLGQSMG
jgi:hypothetical protein